MPIIVYKEYTAVRQGTAVKNETCEKCGGAFAYEVERVVQGSGSSPFFLTNAKAQRDAQTRADAHLKFALKRVLDLVPCPHCGWHQQKMVDALLWPKLREMRFLAWITLLLGSFLAVTVQVMFGTDARKAGHPEEIFYFLCTEIIIVLVWYGTLRLRRYLVGKSDPNRNLNPLSQ